MLKLKLQYFGHLMRRADLLEKSLMLGKIAQGITEARGSGSSGRSQPEGHTGMRGQDLGKCWWAFEEQFHWTWGRVTSQVSTPRVKEGMMAT